MGLLSLMLSKTAVIAKIVEVVESAWTLCSRFEKT